ncbi:MAG TPA: hypothetical protein VJT49_04500 [Amycolatopsis sp.]|uniref:hypothetical protein n=1 Tax=Amycolatopsis sp. TaxID=37632 RepID=UPI002B4813CE|nr:hypothetical protein [Amycolatopsis sp.]HKS44370.1 hypothetical protein [Amycolatopsis sp.]
MSHTQPDARRLAGELLELHGRQDYDALARRIPRMIGIQAPDRHLFRPLLGELATAAAARIRAEADGNDELFTVGLSDETNVEVAVDEVDPPVRATLRAVLAELNHDFESAAVQLSFAADDPNLLGRLDALVHLLSWVNDVPGRPDGPD